MSEEQQAETPETPAVSPEESATKENFIPQTRFNQVVFKQHETQRELDAVREKLSALESKIVPPTLEGLDFDEEKFQSENMKFEVEKQVQETLNSRDEKNRQEAEQKDAQVRYDDFNRKAAKYAADHPNYGTDVQSYGVQIGDNLAQAIVLTDNSPAVHHFLVKHPDQLNALESMPPLQQGIAIGRIVEKMGLTIDQKNTNAPPPIDIDTATGGSTHVYGAKDIEKMSPEQYRAYRSGG